MKRITIEIVCDDEVAMEVEKAYRPIVVDANAYIYKSEKIKEDE